MTTVTRAFLRYLLRRRALSVLQFLGIAVGVASAVGMALTGRAALDSFGRAVDFLQGRATHSLSRPAGPLDEGELRRLAADPGVEAFSPVLDRRVILAGGERVRVLGADPFLDRRFRPDLGPPQGRTLDLLEDPRAVLLDAGLASRLGVGEGALLDTDRGPLRVAGTFPNPAGEPLAFLDIGHAQELFGLRGLLDRVDLILSDADGFRARWEPGFRVQSTGQRLAGLEQMLRAFRLNLEALSLIGLFVGVFLVYNTAMFAVVSRRRDAGILRSLGAYRAEVARAFGAELLLLGGLGGLLGAGLGYLLSCGLTAPVGDAISSIYFFLRPTPPSWSWHIGAAGVLLGCGACALGGYYPLRELLRTDPVAALRGRSDRAAEPASARSAAWAGLGVAALSLALFPAASAHVYAGFAGAFGLLVAASLVTGEALVVVGPGLERVTTAIGGLPGRLAARNIRRNLGRTAVAVAAFAVALSMSVGLGLMIGSFRETLTWWMGSQLTGQVYVASASEVEVPPEAYEEIRQVPGVGGIDPYRNVPLQFRGLPIYLATVDPGVLQAYARFGWVEGGPRSWEEVKEGAVIVSESFRRRFGVGRGDRVTLDGVDGPVDLPVAGVFYDYTTEHGLVMMGRETYRRVFRDETIDSLGVFLDPGTPDPGAVLAEVRRRAAAFGLPVLSREELHANILAVFDATFGVTRSMRVLAVVVAFFGIAGALLTLHLERQRELGIYRALGFSTPQVAGMTLLEGLGMGAASFVLSVGLGTVLAFVLIRVINLRSFHWTIFFHFDGTPYATALATALLASAGAAAYPVWKVLRTFPQVQIREE
ncbi:MAG: FtsX-like permease family protein [Deferrisomatales bacterium]